MTVNSNNTLKQNEIDIIIVSCIGHLFYVTKKSGGIMVIVRDYIAHARKSEYEHEKLNVQCMVIEFLIRKEKWYFITL